jgi:hypothetical protein
LLQRLSAIGGPVFVANGDSDPMILPATPTSWLRAVGCDLCVFG